MHDFIKKIMLKVIEDNCNKVGRKSTESNEHFIDIFEYFINNYTKWKCLDCCILSKYTSDNYRKKFNYWASCHVFEITYNIIIDIINNNIISKRIINNFIIDATNIRNIGGHDNIGKNYADKGKKGNKISILLTEDCYPIDITIIKANEHDNTVMTQIYKKVTRQYKRNRKHKINIIGDKGYVSKDLKKKFLKGKINLITPAKTNQTVRTSKTDKLLLKKRYVIERFNANLKMNVRIRFRYDGQFTIFSEFVYLAIIKCIERKILNDKIDLKLFKIAS